MPLINCEINLFLSWSVDYVIINSTGEGKFKITDPKLSVPFVTISTKDNAKLLQQLKFGFKRTINWGRYQSEPKTYVQSRSLNYLINQCFQGVNKLFQLSFENEDDRKSYSTYYLPKVEIQYYKRVKQTTSS